MHSYLVDIFNSTAANDSSALMDKIIVKEKFTPFMFFFGCCGTGTVAVVENNNVWLTRADFNL